MKEPGGLGFRLGDFSEVYTTAYGGSVLAQAGTARPRKRSLYGWHMDPVCFDKDLRVTIQALGWWPNGKYQPLADDIASVAYRCQAEPHAAFPKLPGIEKRRAR